MDPDACLKELLDAWAAHDDDLVQEKALDLRAWLIRGGFAPEVDRTTMLRLVSLIAHTI